MTRIRSFRFVLIISVAIGYSCYMSYIATNIIASDKTIKSTSTPTSASSRSKSRRLSELFHIPLRPWIEPPPPLVTGSVWNATNIRWVGNSFYFSDDDNDDRGQQQQQQQQRVHLYTPHQIQKAFRKQSVLFQGDSTMRRLYGTLHGILSHHILLGRSSLRALPKGFPENVPQPPFGIPGTYFVRRGLDLRDFDDAASSSVAVSAETEAEAAKRFVLHSPSPIDPRYLDHRTIIDVNKEFLTEPCRKRFPPTFRITPSSFSSNATATLFEYKVCRPHPTGGWLPPLPTTALPPARQTTNAAPIITLPLQYDHIASACLGTIHDFLKLDLAHDRTITKQYTLFVVGSGVWETTQQSSCRRPDYSHDGTTMMTNNKPHTLHDNSSHSSTQTDTWPQSLYRLLEMTLNQLATLASLSPHLMIVWRTSGYYDGDTYTHVLKEMNRRSIQFIDDYNSRNTTTTDNTDHNKHRNKELCNRTNFVYLDWGAAIEHRSHGKDRLKGDMKAHYNLDARVLQVQMLTNLLYEYDYL